MRKYMDHYDSFTHAYPDDFSNSSLLAQSNKEHPLILRNCSKTDNVPVYCHNAVVYLEKDKVAISLALTPSKISSKYPFDIRRYMKAIHAYFENINWIFLTNDCIDPEEFGIFRTLRRPTSEETDIINNIFKTSVTPSSKTRVTYDPYRYCPWLGDDGDLGICDRRSVAIGTISYKNMSLIDLDRRIKSIIEDSHSSAVYSIIHESNYYAATYRYKKNNREIDLTLKYFIQFISQQLCDIAKGKIHIELFDSDTDLTLRISSNGATKELVSECLSHLSESLLLNKDETIEEPNYKNQSLVAESFESIADSFGDGKTNLALSLLKLAYRSTLDENAQKIVNDNLQTIWKDIMSALYIEERSIYIKHSVSKLVIDILSK